MLAYDTLYQAALPPMRDQLPTLPYDLREYARIYTGPSSWLADDDLDEDALSIDEDAFVAGPLIGVGPDDVPRLALTPAQCVECDLDHRQGFILSLLDGCSNVETLIDAAGLPEEETLGILCDLCAKGIVALHG